MARRERELLISDPATTVLITSMRFATWPSKIGAAEPPTSACSKTLPLVVGRRSRKGVVRAKAHAC